MTAPLDGVHVALVTPFAPDGSVDEAVLAELVEDQLSAGLSGLVVGGGTGEGLTLSEEENGRVLAVVVDVAGGRVPVTAHISALGTAATVRNARRALEAGASVGMLQAPYDAPLRDEELVAHARAVAGVGLPIMLYNNVSTGISLSTELVARLAEIDGVAYLKDSSADAARLTEISRLVGDGLQVLLGKDSFALFGFLAGARATVLGSPNAVPEAVVRLHRLTASDADLDAARALWTTLLPVLSFFETEGYVPAVKAATEQRGLRVGAPRPPTLPLGDAQRSELLALLDAVQTAPPAAAGV